MVTVTSALSLDRWEPVEPVQRLTREQMVRLPSGTGVRSFSLVAGSGFRREPLGGAGAAAHARPAGSRRLDPCNTAVARSEQQPPVHLRSEEDDV